MKKAVLLFSAFILSLSLFAQEKSAADVIKFNEMVYDFGKIKQNVPVNHDFSFTNVSGTPIVIESAIASCGCTTPVKPEGAVPKGKTDKINAGFNAAVPGPFNKTITVKVVGQELPVQLRITGEVLTADAYAKYEADKGKAKS
ncbi:MAG TPA: DUF1573 domain-containing protein [Chitinophagaceae bacterium]|jgi:hypothetical protein|nr:DUF1573 domain-containing protein [Chitinophagaceae bacterium]